MESVKSVSVLEQPLAKMPYGVLFVTDLQESIKWYHKAFGFQVVSINNDFSTMEYAPGRCLFLNRNAKDSKDLTFFCKNMKALRRQLMQAGIAIDVDEESRMRIIDPNGNVIEVWNNKYRMEHFQASMPDRTVKGLCRCRLETRGEMHLLGRSIQDDIQFGSVSSELQAWCKEQGIQIVGEPFISSLYSGQVRSEPHVRTEPSGQVETVYVCIAVHEIPICLRTPNISIFLRRIIRCFQSIIRT